MGLLYGFYGDDFTGSTDVLEQLAEGGLPGVLFLGKPDADLRARFSDMQAMGIAGDARSRSPEWMDANLPEVFEFLGEADLVHYKTCSTFDSSASTGSIGKAMEIGMGLLGGVPGILVGAPHLRRYVMAGNLFAAAGNDTFRIDRHPTMSRHPVTPMHEADLRRHLALQTDVSIGLVTFEDMANQKAAYSFDDLSVTHDAVLFDGITNHDLQVAGEILLSRKTRFAVGSSGVTRAITMALSNVGSANTKPALTEAPEVNRMFVVSGSCSPVTADQISFAAKAGYFLVEANVGALLGGDMAEEERLTSQAIKSLQQGGSCVIHSAQGPLDAATPAAGDMLGKALGRVARQVVSETGIERMVFAGGDTSSHGVAQMNIDALTWLAPLETGAPLVRAYSRNSAIDGLELVLKGGQMGQPDFFEAVRRGKASANLR